MCSSHCDSQMFTLCRQVLSMTRRQLIGLSQKRPLWSKAWCCVRSKFCSKFDVWGGVNRHCRFGGKSTLQIWGESSLPILGGVNRHCRFGVNHHCRFDAKLSARFTPPRNRQGRLTPNLQSPNWQWRFTPNLQWPNRQWRFTPPQIVLADLMR